MDHLPLFAALKGQPCLVVGGGDVAFRKTTQLLGAGAAVTVNAPALSAPLQELADADRIRVELRSFDAGLVLDHLLIIAATSEPAVNHAVAAAARAALRLCNVVDDPDASTFISPSIVDRSPLIVAVSTGGRSPVLARMVRQQLERWLPARLGDVARLAGRFREQARTSLPELDARRRFWESAFTGVLEHGRGWVAHLLAGRLPDAEASLQRELTRAGAAPPPEAGEAWLVGAGPGDPELLTLRGFQLLQHADVVLHDRLVAPELLAYARRDAELIDVGKTGGGESTSQATINSLLIERVRAGQRVCRLKGGDPYVFGRGSEEALALADAGLPFQVVPGITAASGCGAYAGIPLTHRDQAHAVTFVAGHLAPGKEPDWGRLAALGQTLVVYMAGRRLSEVSTALIRHGRSATTPAAVVIAGTTPAQRQVTGTLGDIAARAAAAGIASPALLYVGEVAGLGAGLEWFRPAYNERLSGEVR